jgi:uncharacterized protein YunC (DUF1805 family)
MKKAWQTTEFWAALITNLLGIAMLMGYVNVEEGEELGNALKSIAGAVISIATTLGYIKARTDVKKARIEAVTYHAVHKGSDPVAQTRHVEAIKQMNV